MVHLEENIPQIYRSVNEVGDRKSILRLTTGLNDTRIARKSIPNCKNDSSSRPCPMLLGASQFQKKTLFNEIDYFYVLEKAMFTKFGLASVSIRTLPSSFFEDRHLRSDKPSCYLSKTAALLYLLWTTDILLRVIFLTAYSVFLRHPSSKLFSLMSLFEFFWLTKQF